MANPMSHGIPVGAFIPAIKLEKSENLGIEEANIQFVDNYAKIYKKYGIRRDEMMILMPAVMRVDILSGTDKLDYIERTNDKRNK